MNVLLFHFVLSLVLTSLTTLVLGILVFLKNPRRRVNKIFALYSFSIAWWSFWQIGLVASVDRTQALLWARIEQIGVFFIPSLFVHFVLSLLEVRGKRSPLILGYVLSVMFASFSLSRYMMADAVPKFFVRHFATPGELYIWAVSFFIAYVLYALYLLYKEYVSTTGMRKNQIKYLFWSSLIGYLGGSANFLLVFNRHIPVLNPFGTYGVPLYVLATAYAIMRYRLMDINLAITRTAVFVGVYALLLGVPLFGAMTWQAQFEHLLGTRWWVGLWIVGAVLATAAHYVNWYLQREAEARLLRAQRRYQQALLSASNGMTRVRELKRLLRLIVHVITKTVGLTHAAIFLYDSKEETFSLNAFRYHHLASSTDRVRNTDPAVTLLQAIHQPLVLAELRVQMEEAGSRNGAPDQNAQAYAQMTALNASVLVPSFIQERLIGFLVLGEKRSGQIFTTEDLNVFSTLANQAALAIENARFYEEERQRQEALFHAAALASLGTMASGMSHQVNNRFNVVSLIAQMQKAKLQALLHNDSDDPIQLRKALEECLGEFESLEEEARRGGQVVASIRKLTRPSPDGYRPISLAAAIQIGLDVVQHKVRFDELNFELSCPEDLPEVRGDLSQLGECFLNLIDNAYDAIQTKEELLEAGKLPHVPRTTTPFRGAILIQARAVDARTIEVTIADNGVGVVSEDLSKLFVPFYTTKATAEKGTGLGLYVIKQIVEAHGGIVRVASQYGAGTTFIITLPTTQGVIGLVQPSEPS